MFTNIPHPHHTHSIPEIDLLHQEGRSAVIITAYCIVSSFQQGPYMSSVQACLGPLYFARIYCNQIKSCSPFLTAESRVPLSRVSFMFCGIHTEPGVPRAKMGVGFL